MPFVVGLTGGIGSGKSAASQRFEALGAAVVDTDAIAHELTAPGGAAMEAIRARFGPEVVAADGRLDRARMRALAFAEPDARRHLEGILHPMIRRVARERAEASRAPYVLMVIPLLAESASPRATARRIAVVDCSRETQIRRTMARSQLDRATVERILDAQATREQRLAIADDVIDNEGSLETLDARVRELHASYLRLASAGPLPDNP